MMRKIILGAAIAVVDEPRGGPKAPVVRYSSVSCKTQCDQGVQVVTQAVLTCSVTQGLSMVILLLMIGMFILSWAAAEMAKAGWQTGLVCMHHYFLITAHCSRH